MARDSAAITVLAPLSFLSAGHDSRAALGGAWWKGELLSDFAIRMQHKGTQPTMEQNLKVSQVSCNHL